MVHILISVLNSVVLNELKHWYTSLVLRGNKNNKNNLEFVILDVFILLVCINYSLTCFAFLKFIYSVSPEHLGLFRHCSVHWGQ